VVVVPVAAGANPPSRSPWSLYTASQRWRFLLILFLVTVCGNFDYYVLGAVLDPIKHEFQVSDAALGFLSGLCFAFCYAVSALPFARWSDRGNRRTVLTVALAGWSLMTSLCGLASSFWQLLLARLGVGITEPGATPPAQSLIVDYFPPGQRGRAIAMMVGGGSVGQLLGIALGGYVAAAYGWRSTFVYAGLFGVILAACTRLILSEPRDRGPLTADQESETLREVLSRLGRKRSYLYLVAGMSGYFFVSVGLVTFLPSHMIRAMHATLTEATVTWGIAISVANLLGTLGGGWLADYLSQRDVRWYAWLPALASLLVVPLYWFALANNHLLSFISIDFFAELVLGAGVISAWPAIHAVCGTPRRAMAVAVMQCAYILLGCGLGPLAVGTLSDLYLASVGPQNLGKAMKIVTLMLIPTAVAFYCAGLNIQKEREE
jgi:predicted MFS family arabinose efflux permease